MGHRSRLQRGAGTLLLAVAFLVATPHGARADEGTLALRDFTNAAMDLHTRVNAAGVLGRARPVGARLALENALGDAHPALRGASAEALGSLGDPSAVSALEQHSASEPIASVKAQMLASIDRLRGAAASPSVDRAPSGPAREVRFVIALGAMRNGTGVRGDELSHVLSDAARTRTHALPGASVMETDASARKQAAVKHVPLIRLDGNVAQMVESQVAGSVQVHARVEFTVRRDQTLKGTVSGAATTFGSGGAISDQARRQLQNDAVDGAVQSALRGAGQGLIVAVR